MPTWLSPDMVLIISVCTAAILGGGLIKGTLGVGLPLFAVPVMSLFISSTQAIALVSVPVLVSNIWQVWQEGSLKTSLKRFWPLMLTQAIMTVLSVYWTLSFSIRELNMVLALALIVAVVLMAFKPSFNIPPDKEPAISALVGVTSGLLGGASSLMGPIVISYMMSLKLSRDEFVGCISVIYLNAAWPLYLAMWHFGRMSLDDVGYSFFAIIPMFLGLQAGRKIRHLLSEETFRRALLGFLIAVAVLLLFR
jgi:uncharacterized membrane protein YfcA